MLRYLRFNTENRETVRITGMTLFVFGTFAMIYSIVSFAMFANGMGVGKFLLLFFFCILACVGGVVLFSKATLIAHQSVHDRRYHYFVLLNPLVLLIVIVVIIEELYNCTSCVAASAVFLIVCILCFLLVLLAIDFYKKKTSNTRLKWEDLDRWMQFDPNDTPPKPLSNEEKQSQVEARLQKLSESEISHIIDADNRETQMLVNDLINQNNIQKQNNSDDEVHRTSNNNNNKDEESNSESDSC